jgi:hypothetical protein
MLEGHSCYTGFVPEGGDEERKIQKEHSVIVKHEDVWGNGGKYPKFLTSIIDGVGCLVLCPGRFSPKKKSAASVGQKVGELQISALLMKEKSDSFQDSNPGCRTHSPSLYRLS